MVHERDNTLDLEKLKISERLESIEKSFKVESEMNRALIRKIYGDPDANPPIKGYEARLQALEKIEDDREKTKERLLQMAVGSLTIAIGGAVIWIFIVLKTAFISKQ